MRKEFFPVTPLFCKRNAGEHFDERKKKEGENSFFVCTSFFPLRKRKLPLLFLLYKKRRGDM